MHAYGHFVMEKTPTWIYFIQIKCIMPEDSSVCWLKTQSFYRDLKLIYINVFFCTLPFPSLPRFTQSLKVCGKTFPIWSNNMTMIDSASQLNIDLDQEIENVFWPKSIKTSTRSDFFIWGPSSHYFNNLSVTQTTSKSILGCVLMKISLVKPM